MHQVKKGYSMPQCIHNNKSKLVIGLICYGDLRISLSNSRLNAEKDIVGVQ